jgi:hypothetical protein
LASRFEGVAMLDLIFLAATVLLFWSAIVYVRRCDRI